MSWASSVGQYLFGVPPVSSSPYQQQAQQAQQQAQQYAGREQSDYASQKQLADSLWNTVNGRGPSIADIKLQQSLDQGLQQATAMGAGGTGQNAVLARYLATAGYNPAQAAQAGAALKAQETANAQRELAGVQGQMEGASGNLYGANLQNGLGYSNLTNQVDEANAARQQQAEAAGLQALSGLGSMYFGSKAPTLNFGGGPAGGSGIAASYDASGGAYTGLTPGAYGAGYSAAAPGYGASRSAGSGGF